MMRRFLIVLFLAAALFVPALFAQSQDAPKYEVFGGYSWYHPGGSIPATGTLSATRVQNLAEGVGGQFTYNLNHWAGIALDANGHYSDFGNIYSVAGGPQFKVRRDGLTPFGEALLGWQRIGPKAYPNQNTAVFMLGGGIEYPLNPHFTVRFFQADYVNSYYTKVSPAGTTNTFNGLRLQAGLVWNLGLTTTENKVGATCDTQPTAVEAGVPVKITVTPSGFLPKRVLTYGYSASAGTRIAAKDSTATVETAGLAPGNYAVAVKVSDNGKGKHQQMANCESGFSVNEPPRHPPVLSLSVSPTSLVSGDAATVTASGSSPDNRPLSFSCKASAGRLSGNGPTYTLDTAGVQGGGITVNCQVSDDRNLTASATTSVRVSVPPPAPVASDFGTVKFEHDALRPTRVDNEAKGTLDRYSDALAAAPDSKGVVVGYAMAAENVATKGSRRTPEIAAERAVNTKDYVKEKGIDPSRIQPRIGGEESQKTELWIVPPGATFPAANTSVVDESKVKAVPRVPLPMRKVHKKAHKAAPRKAVAHKATAHAAVHKTTHKMAHRTAHKAVRNS